MEILETEVETQEANEIRWPFSLRGGLCYGTLPCKILTPLGKRVLAKTWFTFTVRSARFDPMPRISGKASPFGTAAKSAMYCPTREGHIIRTMFRLPQPSSGVRQTDGRRNCNV